MCLCAGGGGRGVTLTFAYYRGSDPVLSCVKSYKNGNVSEIGRCCSE